MSNNFTPGRALGAPIGGCGGYLSDKRSFGGVRSLKSLSRLMDPFFFLLGSLFHVATYESLEPVACALLAFGLGLIITKILFPALRLERMMYVRVFSVGWLMAGIAAYYAYKFDDPSQNYSDAFSFYELSVRFGEGMSLEEIKRITEGSAAVVLWRSFYDAFAFFGFQKLRYIGSLLNILFVSFSGVVAVRSARYVYGNDVVRIQRLILLFSCCGLFWLFQAIHIRDSAVLFAVSLFFYFWVRYLSSSSKVNLLALAAASACFPFIFLYLRREFFFVPFVAFFAGAVALALFVKSRGRGKLLVALCTLFLFPLVLVSYTLIQSDLSELLARGHLGYLDASQGAADADSLGMALVVEQSMPLRVILGSLYLYIFPIPFWGGFGSTSAYHLFKSGNALFFYFVNPLLVLTLLTIFNKRETRISSVMFLLFVILGFTASIAATSLETRHLGVFYVPLFVLILLPDLTAPVVRRRYQRFLLISLTLMGAVHAVWFMLKS